MRRTLLFSALLLGFSPFLLPVLNAQPARLAFQSPVVLSTGAATPNDFAAGDFNGDGKPDLAVPDQLGKTVSIYLNQGGGQFGAPVVTTLAIDNTVGSIVAGDLNEDGKDDLVVSTVAGDQVALVLLGSGDGHFTAQPPITGSFGFLSGKVVDFNGDGHLDLVLGGSGEPYLFFGRGDGTFTQESLPNRSFPGLYASVTVGVFSGSGHMDAVLADYGDPDREPGSIDYFPGEGHGSVGTTVFYKPSFIQNPASLDAADFNQDGKLDLLISDTGGTYVGLGNGDGTFLLGGNQLIPMSANSPEISASVAADLDHDGKPDVVMLGTQTGLLSLVLNDGTGTLNAFQTAYTSQLAPQSYHLATADLNGDGLPDIIVSSPVLKSITILLSEQAVSMPTVTLTSSAQGALAGSSLVFTAKVAGGGKTPTGMVSLLEGSSTLGQQTLDATGTAVFNIAGLSPGSHSLTAQYAGNADFKQAASSTFSQTVTDFQLSLLSSTQTVPAGSSAAYSLAVAPVAGFTGTVTISCSDLPSGASCGAQSMNVSGGPVSGTVTVATSASALALAEGAQEIVSACTLLGGFAFCFLRPGFFGRRRRALVLPFLSAVAIAMSGAGCGGGSSKVSPAPVPHSAASNFTINVTATQDRVMVTHSVPAALIIQS